MSNSKQYPLQYPVGRPRNQYPERSKFKPGSIYSEAQSIFRQLELMGASDIIISSNMQYRADGLPYTRQNVQDTGVAVYFKSAAGEEQCIPCDSWITLEENMRAIAKTIEAMRGIERWGGKALMNAAFSGFKALPSSTIITAPPDRQHRDWWVVLGVDRAADAPTVKQAYRRAQATAHPDAGGSEYDFQEVQAAYEEWKNS